MRKRKANYSQVDWEISGQSIPIKIYKEWRASRRVSIRKNEVIVRIPNIGILNHENQHIEWAKKWLRRQVLFKPSILDHFKNRTYSNGDPLHTTQKSYIIYINSEPRKTGRVICKGNRILLNIPIDLNPNVESKLVSNLIGRILAQDNINWVQQRVNWLNDHYIHKDIRSVSLKNNKSNWGSCSSKGNINISVRLLFVPQDVQDYVFIHELAHLKQLNHTSKFWAIVEKIMPDYRNKEKWLKEQSHICNF